MAKSKKYFTILLILRCLRIDRLIYAIRQFIAIHLSDKCIESNEFNLELIHQQSTISSPLLFILSPGIDPTNKVQMLANKYNKQLHICSLGQRQAPIATKLISSALQTGNWVFLANCHLSIKWLPTLAKMVENYTLNHKNIHQDFRLWLSSDHVHHFLLVYYKMLLK